AGDRDRREQGRRAQQVMAAALAVAGDVGRVGLRPGDARLLAEPGERVKLTEDRDQRAAGPGLGRERGGYPGHVAGDREARVRGRLLLRGDRPELGPPQLGVVPDPVGEFGEVLRSLVYRLRNPL